ncbi:MAG: YcnI family protein [Egibacteraceae bacterium]
MSIARRTVCVAVLAAALILLPASAALAHVTVRADNTTPGGFAKYTVRVPNESDSASTTEIEVRMPDGFGQASVQPKPGWRMQLEGGVLTISGGKISPGQFDEFSFSARNPEAAGDLTFPAIQTYDDGTVANWTGQPDAEEPAPVVKIAGTPQAEHSGGGHGGGQAAPAASEAAPAATGTSAMPVAIAGLVVGLLGLGLGGAAFARTRRA